MNRVSLCWFLNSIKKLAEIPMPQSALTVANGLPLKSNSNLTGIIGTLIVRAAVGLSVSLGLIFGPLVVGYFALKIMRCIGKNIKTPLNVFAMGDWKPSTVFEFSAWYAWLLLLAG